MSLTGNDDEHWMRLALREAEKALAADEVPVGAVVVHDHRLIGRGHNRVETLGDATAHAEVLAIGAAAESLGTWRLNDATLYVTLEPCLMCAGAMKLARVKRLVFGTVDPQAGVFGSKVDLALTKLVEVGVTSGVLAAESLALLQEFFQKVRERNKQHTESSLENQVR